MNNTTNEFKTKDLYHAVALRAKHIPLLRIEKSNEKHCFFIFNNTANAADQIIQDYWERKLMIEARGFIESIRELKSRIGEISEKQ